MIYLFTLLFLVSLIAAFVGLAKPSAFQFGKQTVPNRWKVFGLSLLVSFVSLAIVGVLAPKVEEKAETVAAEKPKTLDSQTETPVVMEKDLGVTSEEFLNELNKNLISYDISYLKPIDKLNIESGDVNDTFQIMFTDAVGVVGTLKKTDHKLKELTVVFGGSSESDLVDLTIVLGTMAKIASGKEKAPKEILELVTKSIQEKNKNFTEQIDNIYYKAYTSDETGTLVVLSK